MVPDQHLENKGHPSASISLPVYGVLSVVSLSLAVILHHIKHRCQRTPIPIVATHPDPWTQSSKMEKAETNSCPSSTKPSPASATEVLEPLSRDGSVPTSGAVAARAREQRHSAGPLRASNSDPKTRSGGVIEGNCSVQKCSESVQQMREVDGEGVRTWKRLIVEYH